jgi:hypothetical protein
LDRINNIDIQFTTNQRNRRLHAAIYKMVHEKHGNSRSWRYTPHFLCDNYRDHNATGLIAGDGNVHIVDKEENTWSLRSVLAKNLVSLIEGKFSVEQITYTEDLSMTRHID